MIIRERTETFILIEQKKHGIVAKQIFEELFKELIENDPKQKSLLTAIASHDDGWHYVDQIPFWNDEKTMPFQFIDFPTMPKIPLYHYGINLVSEKDSYAAALCSAHYTRFLKNRTEKEARHFVQEEKKRQNNLLQNSDSELFQRHFAMLRLADNLSLFLCLNEPQTKAENIHFFFEKGIHVPAPLDQELPQFIGFEWKESLMLKGLKQPKSISISVPYREIEKKALANKSLAKAYHATPEKMQKIEINTF